VWLTAIVEPNGHERARLCRRKNPSNGGGNAVDAVRCIMLKQRAGEGLGVRDPIGRRAGRLCLDPSVGCPEHRYACN
jgi:hypothetical protein